MPSRIPIWHIGSVIYFTFDGPKIMVSSQADSGAGRALLTAIVTWISANFELPPRLQSREHKAGAGRAYHVRRWGWKRGLIRSLRLRDSAVTICSGENQC